MEPLEKICAWKLENRDKPECVSCDGYPVQGCTGYTTVEHLKQFNKIFGIPSENYNKANRERQLSQ
jgi:hypothetical protein